MMPAMATLAAYGAALALTLLLAAWLTPRAWWRRPNLKALAVLGGGTLAFGVLFAAWIGEPRPALAAAAPALVVEHAGLPAAGAGYLVIDELNLRDGRGIRAQRLAVLPAGTRVTATGAFDGDWWRVRARVDGRVLEGWASSLWLRRADERRNTH
jgi:hypothetical protein